MYRLVQIEKLSTVQGLESIRQPIQSDLNGDDIEKTETLVNTNVNHSKTITFKFTKPQKALTAGEQTRSNGNLIEQHICGERKMTSIDFSKLACIR